MIRGSYALAFALAVAAYAPACVLHPVAFVYDDRGTVTKNAAVASPASTPVAEIWRNDFWGERLTNPSSHKSFRPLTTMSFRWNTVLSGLDARAFRLTNVALHAIVSALVVPAIEYSVVGVADRAAAARIAAVAGALFATHPIHVEAVANVSGRAELLSACFFLAGFVAYARYVVTHRDALGIAIALACTVAATLSKEHGVTLPVVCVAWDALRYLSRGGGARFRCVFARAVALGVATVAFAALRLSLNGGSPPKFVRDQNPAAFLTDRTWRLLSHNWIWLWNLRLLILPLGLCCDWSGDTIPLLTSLRDPRVALALALDVALLSALALAALRWRARRWALLCAVAWFGIPFLLASNLVVVVGFVVAERALYLPSVGFAALSALLFEVVRDRANAQTSAVAPVPQEQSAGSPQVAGQHSSSSSSSSSTAQSSDSALSAVYAGLAALIIAYTLGSGARAREWNDGHALWSSAYRVNPTSAHVLHQYGLELSWKGDSRAALSDPRLRHAAKSASVAMFEASLVSRPDQHSTLFALALSLNHVGRPTECLEVVANASKSVMRREQELSEEAAEVADSSALTADAAHKQQLNAHAKTSLARDKSNLLTAQGLCTQDISTRGKLLYAAAVMDPTNQFAINEGMQLLESVKRAQQQQQQKGGSN